MKIWIDGKYFEEEEARVSVFDHGFLYGDGVFEGIRVYGGNVFKLREHLMRLYESSRAILLGVPLSPPELEAAVLDAVRTNEGGDAYIRLIVSRGKGALGISPSSCPKPTVIIIVGSIELYPQEYYEKGLELVTASTRRIPPDSLDPRIKSLNYLNNIMAKLEAARAGCHEAVILNHDGRVAECSADNIALAKGQWVISPPASEGALQGITMGAVMELAERLGYRPAFLPITRHDLYTAEECFMTGTGAEIVPVVSIDGRPIGTGMPGPVTRRLMSAFHSMACEARTEEKP